ncbi:hypothetical protein BDA96_06G051500 [Sorghum bicolor]|uniref:Uncharacterized protein n=2 Tax=Sorghum bicolor TaxID=4558 RepID=A0A1Z5RC68_SORBI|nr:hypothetical protein BDA96_06G051500 [Sorghum bicolor]OQU81342.1 hypothetical protein SORBI_3006G044932 [Sorghum bicolor]
MPMTTPTPTPVRLSSTGLSRIMDEGRRLGDLLALAHRNHGAELLLLLLFWVESWRKYYREIVVVYLSALDLLANLLIYMLYLHTKISLHRTQLVSLSSPICCLAHDKIYSSLTLRLPRSWHRRFLCQNSSSSSERYMLRHKTRTDLPYSTLGKNKI